MTRIKIKDIARMANVSMGTVDRVIHNRSGVSVSTRKKVQAIIEEHDYQPYIIAGTLASGRTCRILVCMPEAGKEHAFWRFPEWGVERAIEELRHFDVSVEYLRFSQHSRTGFQRKTGDLDLSSYDGVLFAPVFNDLSSNFINVCRQAGIPCILFNSRIEGASIDGFIGQDAYQSGYLAAKLMSYGLPFGKDLLIVNLSHRKDNYQHIVERERGFRAYFEEHSDRINNLVSVNLNRGNYDCVSGEIVQKMEALDVAGIFVTNSRVHVVAGFLAEKGFMSIRLIGYDLLAESIEYLQREYIDFLISQSPEEQSYLGFRYLFDKVMLKRDIPEEVLLPIDILTKENIFHYLKFNKSYD